MGWTVLPDPQVSSQHQVSPLVSVLVPAFNHQEYIEACLDSVVESSYAPLEILVLDDGSNDGTYDRACAWMKNNAHRVERVKVHHQTNLGITRTLNKLISLSGGEYVTLLASDDALERDGIMLRVTALQRHPEWLAVFGDCSIIDGTGRLQATSALSSLYHAHVPALLNPHRITRELILRWSVAGPSMLARRLAYSVDVGVGPYDEQLQVEDRDFYLKLLSRDGLGFINETVARYRVHGRNGIFTHNSVGHRDVVMAEWRHRDSFAGLNRCLLTLVAVRGRVQLRSIRENEQDHRLQGQIFWLIGRGLAVVQKSAHLLHRLLG